MLLTTRNSRIELITEMHQTSKHNSDCTTALETRVIREQKKKASININFPDIDVHNFASPSHKVGTWRPSICGFFPFIFPFFLFAVPRPLWTAFCIHNRFIAFAVNFVLFLLGSCLRIASSFVSMLPAPKRRSKTASKERHLPRNRRFSFNT